MSLGCYIGPEAKLTDTTPANSHRLFIPHPILAIKSSRPSKSLTTVGGAQKVIDITRPREEGADGMRCLRANLPRI